MSHPPRPDTEVEEAAALLSRLIAIPSLTLAEGQPAPDDRYGEARMAAAVAEYLEALSLHPETDEVEPGRPQVMARIGSGKPELLLTAHLDTVPPVGWSRSPFLPVRRGTRVEGLGACDVKGTLTAMLLVMKRLAARPALPLGTVTFIGMVGEEMFGVGSRHLVRSGYRPDAAIIGEPTEMRLVRAECGNVRWRFHTLGRAAHGSRPWTGDSALYRMAEALRVLENEVAPGCAARTHPLTGPAAFNAGLIQGGSAINIVPDRCTLSVERRILPGEAAAGEMEAINELLTERIGAEWLEFEPPIALNDPLDTPEDHPLVRAFQTALSGHGLDPTPTGVSYGSDANRLAAVEVPCVVFGPGSIAHAHTNAEWIDLRDLALSVPVLEAAVLQYLANA